MFTTKPLSLSFFFLFSILVLAQKKQTNLDTWTYDQLKEAFFKNEGKAEIQKTYAKAFLNRAKKENNTPKIARGYYYHSLLYSNDTKIIYFDSIINNVVLPPSEKNFPFFAYLEKGYYLEKKYKYEEAINNYLIVEKLALSKNIIHYYQAKFAIAVLKSEKMGEVREALPLIKACFEFYKSQNQNKELSFEYEASIFAMADAYKSLNELDKASYYNTLGFKETIKSKNEYLHHLFILNEGANQVKQKNFRATLDSIKKALPVLIKYKDVNNELASYYYKALAYKGLNDIPKVVENFIKVDSMYQKNKTITPEFSDGYKFLISYYKANKDFKNQLKYLTTYLSIQTQFQKEYKELSTKLKYDYDFPNLVKEKESLINNLKQDEKKYYWIIFLLTGLVFCFFIFSVYQNSLRKKYKSNFDKLINSSNKVVEQKDSTEQLPLKKESKLSATIINDLSLGLTEFEKKKLFKNPNLSILHLATELNTNTKYLSTFINEHINKSFVIYINDLRIDDIIEELKQNKNLRKYTIAALAEEAGFKTAESFSTAFYKRTGIKPSFFVKKINESKY